ncbi:MAG: heavy metal translocating P-type ATPase, partial [Myxococcota bacterium]
LLAERVRADGGTETVVPDSLQPGDRVRVRPGAAVPADGLVVEGAGSVDEALLSGEARPVAKHAGDRVLAGAVNRSSALTVEVTAVGEATRLAGIVRLAERAALARPPAAALAERAARGFLTVLLVVAAGVAVVWSLVDPSRALAVTVAVLVVSCPCALSLATPAAFAAAASAAAARGILAVRPGAFETLARATHFVFDKTGTLTAGKPRVIGELAIGATGRADCMALAAALERDTEHPFGVALKRAAGPARLLAEAVEYRPGQGIEGTVEGCRLRIGRPEWVGELAGPLPLECAFVAPDVSAVALGAAGQWLALFTLADAPRSDARAVVQALIAGGAQVTMLSGDRPDAVAALAARLGIADARGAATPEDKLAAVRALQADGAVVCMVGDGVNDAATLAQADVSLAMGEGTDLAHAAADCVLLSGRLGAVAEAVELARRTRAIVRQNLAWALFYNLVAIPLAAFGWVTPLAAGAGMALSSLAVAANALRLLPRRRDAEAAAVTGASVAPHAI